MNHLDFISEQANLRACQYKLNKIQKLLARYWRHIPTGLKLELQKLEVRK